MREQAVVRDFQLAEKADAYDAEVYEHRLHDQAGTLSECPCRDCMIEQAIEEMRASLSVLDDGWGVDALR